MAAKPKTPAPGVHLTDPERRLLDAVRAAHAAFAELPDRRPEEQQVLDRLTEAATEMVCRRTARRVIEAYAADGAAV